MNLIDLCASKLCGSHPDCVSRAAQVISQEMNVDFIDINVGCPIDFVIKRVSGSIS